MSDFAIPAWQSKEIRLKLYTLYEEWRQGLNCLYPGRFWKIFNENVREKPNRKNSKS